MLISFLLIAVLLAPISTYYYGRRYEQKKRIVTYRFVCPKKKVKQSFAVPKVVYQTWKETSFDRIETKIAVSMNSWRQLNPDWKYNLFSDEQCREFVEEHHPDALEAYDMLPKPVEKADLFRYLAILSFGGVYADVDCTCIKPIEEWVHPN